MNLQQRIEILDQTGQYLLASPESWNETVRHAGQKNGWFTEAFVKQASEAIATRFLQAPLLKEWMESYGIPPQNLSPKDVGIVMAGNIPLVGFHDLLCVFISGHRARVKLSSKDDVLIPHLVEKMAELDPTVKDHIRFEEQLKGCDAYIATGSNNSSRYFDYYFSRFPHIIRRNRTSVALLDGMETAEELDALARDIFTYYGLGCRNVTKLLLPRGYDFSNFFRAVQAYDYLLDEHKYKHNLDYNLTLLIMNRESYLHEGPLLLVERASPFSPIGQLHYAYYEPGENPLADLNPEEIQCVVGHGHIAFGEAQSPGLRDYADGVDVMAFLKGL